MINFAKKADIPEIMEFIDIYWKKNHILTKNRNFFEYFYGTGTENINFVISRNKKNKINGILGFVSYDKEKKNISLALWKALPEQDSFVGLELFDYLICELKPEIVATLGVNIETSGEIYLLYDYILGKMDHYYRLSDIDNYKIAKINNKTILNLQDTEKVIVQKINSVEEIPSDFPFDKNALPKNNEYIEHRYFKHPVYKYDLFLFGNDLIVATRIQKYNDSACLRIVDIMGNYSKIPYITGFFDKYMKENMLEYADCYCTKLSSEIWNKAGFIELKTEENIIPEHFAPYECKNIDICYSSSQKEIILFKGDGDMDRPS